MELQHLFTDRRVTEKEAPTWFHHHPDHPSPPSQPSTNRVPSFFPSSSKRPRLEASHLVSPSFEASRPAACTTRGGPAAGTGMWESPTVQRKPSDLKLSQENEKQKNVSRKWRCMARRLNQPLLPTHYPLFFSPSLAELLLQPLYPPPSLPP